MKVLIVNSVCGIGSTGRICVDIADRLTAEGHEVKIAYGRGTVPEKWQKYAIKIGNSLDQKIHGVSTRIFDNHGFGSKKATDMFLKWADKYNPDLVWLHNIHGYYINVESLFVWIKSCSNMQVKWTLHDCWAFTGHCVYFTMANCDKWQTQCQSCPQKKCYPTSFVKDNSANNYTRKKQVFSGVGNMTIITPSKWLADLVSKSFLNEYKVDVCHNTIDTTVFKPTPSDFRKKYALENVKIILGVASVWDKRKGLEDFVRLAKLIDEKWRIILVGLNEKQMRDLPSNIISISHTNSIAELAEIYTAADVLFNPTYEDNYPTVNLEAQSCGTPVITYNTGGSIESVPENNVICQGDVEAFLKLIQTSVPLEVKVIK